MKLNIFTYEHMTERGYCGDPDRWHSWIFITPLDESQVKARMQQYAESLPTGEGYCHGAFINSISNEGILIESHDDLIDTDYITGGLLGDEICLDGIKEEDIFSEQKYSELIAARAEAARLEQEKRAEEARQRRLAQEKREIELAAKKLEQAGYTVTKEVG